MAFCYLLLGHLIGDFVLQTDKMAENKSRYWRWSLLHVLVVTMCITAFSYTFGLLMIAMVLLNGAMHFFMDYYKNRLCNILHLSELSGFLIDQLIHILILYIISQAAVYGTQHLIDFKTVNLLISLVFATFFSAVFTQFILARIFPNKESGFFRDGEKYTGIFTRVYTAVVFYISFIISPYFLLFLAIAPAMYFLRFRLGWNKWMSPSHLAVKLILDTAISFACILPIISRI